MGDISDYRGDVNDCRTSDCAELVVVEKSDSHETSPGSASASDRLRPNGLLSNSMFMAKVLVRKGLDEWEATKRDSLSIAP